TSDFVSDEENLRTALFTGYTPAVRPQQTTEVTILQIPLSLNKLDIGEQLMSMSTLSAMVWFDQRLTWDPTVNGGIQFITVDTDKVWTPSVVVENAVEKVGTVGGKSNDGTPLRIAHFGLIFWYPPMEMSTSCEMRIAKETDLVYYSANGEWDMQGTWSDTGYFTDGTQFFKRLNFYFTFRRKWQFYGQNLVLPIVLTSILMCAVFALPIESGEKMGFSLTVLLSYVVFLTWVTDNLPAVSTDVSVLQVYLAIVLGLGVLATLLTTWVLHLYHRDASTPMSSFMRFFVRHVLAPLKYCTCCKKRQDSKEKERYNARNSSDKETRNKVAPADTTPTILLPLSKGSGFDEAPVSRESRETDGARSRASRDEREDYTWPEVAAMADRFFLILFSAVMMVVTSCSVGVLYTGY
ncbi:hypothetical protein BaRGS_00038879, partial [Batillaria attramentaria]